MTMIYAWLFLLILAVCHAPEVICASDLVETNTAESNNALLLVGETVTMTDALHLTKSSRIQQKQHQQHKHQQQQQQGAILMMERTARSWSSGREGVRRALEVVIYFILTMMIPFWFGRLYKLIMVIIGTRCYTDSPVMTLLESSSSESSTTPSYPSYAPPPSKEVIIRKSASSASLVPPPTSSQQGRAEQQTATAAEVVVSNEDDTAGESSSSSLPIVTIQICCYNEASVIEETMNAACSVDWPKDKLVVQVLDDSTDVNCSRLIEQVAERWRSQHGVDCSRLFRPDRVGYKAGNLWYHASAIRGDLVAILDSDHRCERRWLREVIPYFMDDINKQRSDEEADVDNSHGGRSSTERRKRRPVGLVQSPWAFYNTHECLLTEFDAFGCDCHHVCDQAGSYYTHKWYGFNGTGGVWHKDAIQAAGGWSWETLCEDLDLSLCAHLAGYDFVYSRHTPLQLELPSDILAFVQQKNRWTKGCIQVARKIIAKLPHSRDLSFFLTFELVLRVVIPIPHILYLILFILLPILSYMGGVTPLMMSVYLIPHILDVITGFLTCYAKVAGRNKHYHSLWSRTCRLSLIPVMIVLGKALCVFETYGIYEGLTSDDATFIRTPKTGNSDDKVGGDDDDNSNVDTSQGTDDGYKKAGTSLAETASNPDTLRGDEVQDQKTQGDEAPKTKAKDKSLSNEDNRFVINCMLGFSGLVLAAYDIVWATVLYLDATSVNWVDIVVIASLILFSLGLLFFHGKYVHALFSTRKKFTKQA